MDHGKRASVGDVCVCGLRNIVFFRVGVFGNVPPVSVLLQTSYFKAVLSFVLWPPAAGQSATTQTWLEEPNSLTWPPDPPDLYLSEQLWDVVDKQVQQVMSETIKVKTRSSLPVGTPANKDTSCNASRMATPGGHPRSCILVLKLFHFRRATILFCY